jgi:hypothetical protein
MLKKLYRWRGFEEAREFVRGLGLKNSLEWIAFCKSGRSRKISLTIHSAFIGGRDGSVLGIGWGRR